MDYLTDCLSLHFVRFYTMIIFLYSLFQSSISAGLTANGWINEIVPLINGKGGGKEASAQATGTNTGALKEAMDIATKFAGLKLS